MQDGSAPGQITALIGESRNGNLQALDELREVVYPELRRLARLHWSHERRGHTLQPTAIANEAFLRLFRGRIIPWSDSHQFFLSAAREVRRVLVDYARKFKAEKRGYDLRKVTLDDVWFSSDGRRMPDLIDLEVALEALAAGNPRAEQIITLKFYSGCTIDEICEILEVSHNTVERESKWACAWLLQRLSAVRKPVDAR